MKSICQFASVALLLSCSLFTGCLTGPYDGELVGESINDSIHTHGWVQQPNKLISIQVRKNSNQPWVQIGTTYSSPNSIQFDGQSFYSWKKSVVVPAAYWTDYVTNSNPPQYVDTRTHLRAVMGNTVLTTFDTDIESIIVNDPSVTIEELVGDHAAGNSVQVRIKHN